MGREKGIKFRRIIALRLEDDLGEVVEEMADEEDRPVGVMARILIREAVVARGRIAPEDRKRKGKK